MDNPNQEKKEVLLRHDSINESSIMKKKKDKIFLEWSNINYTIVTKCKNKKVQPQMDPELPVGEYIPNATTPTNHKIILKNIEGFAVPNELLAIMGPSGCGKTSLLNIIAHRQLTNDKSHIISREV